MNKVQAIKKARGLWGAKGAAVNQAGCGWYAVGVLMLGMFVCWGSGSSWTAAFEAAEKRGHGARPVGGGSHE